LHCAAVAVVLPVARHEPAAQALHAAAPAALKKPTGHATTAVEPAGQ